MIQNPPKREDLSFPVNAKCQVKFSEEAKFVDKMFKKYFGNLFLDDLKSSEE